MNLRVAINTNEELERKLISRSLTVAVIGLGYVGLPLVNVFWQAGVNVVGLDIDRTKIIKLANGESYISHFAPERVAEMNASGRFAATDDFSALAEADAILICVPTPITATREPDLSFVISTTEAIAKNFRKGALIILESTTYPGTTKDVVRPILEKSGLKAGVDFHLAFSPEREDPGSAIETKSIPKIVGGIDAYSGELAADFYALGFTQVHKVSDAQTVDEERADRAGTQPGVVLLVFGQCRRFIQCQVQRLLVWTVEPPSLARRPHPGQGCASISRHDDSVKGLVAVGAEHLRDHPAAPPAKDSR